MLHRDKDKSLKAFVKHARLADLRDGLLDNDLQLMHFFIVIIAGKRSIYRRQHYRDDDFSTMEPLCTFDCFFHWLASSELQQKVVVVVVVLVIFR